MINIAALENTAVSAWKIMKKVGKEQAVCVHIVVIFAIALAAVVTRQWSVSNPCTSCMAEIFIDFNKIVSSKSIILEIVWNHRSLPLFTEERKSHLKENEIIQLPIVLVKKCWVFDISWRTWDSSVIWSRGGRRARWSWHPVRAILSINRYKS